MIKVVWISIHDLDALPSIGSLCNGLPDEFVKRADSYVKEKDRFFSLLGKLLVAFCYRLMYNKEIDWSKADFSDSSKKPKYDGDFYFNISHSGTIVACAFSHEDIGLDIQQINPIDGLDYKLALTEEEYDVVLKSEDKHKAFWEYWVLKEATLKLTGEGLLGDLHVFNFSNRNSSLMYQGRLIHTSSFVFLDNEDYLGALAVNNSGLITNIQEVKFNKEGLLY